MGVTRQAPAAITDGLVLELETEGQKEGEDTLEKRLRPAAASTVLHRENRRSRCGFLVSVWQLSPCITPGSQVVRAHEEQWGEALEISRVG